MESYATPAELAAWMDPDAEEPEVPALATVLLRSATQLVLDAVASARYSIDAFGHPVGTVYRTAVREATMEQASAWSLAGIDPRLGVAQLARRVKSKGLGNGSVNVTYEDADAQLLALATAEQLTAEAWRILDNAGMITNRASTIGPGRWSDYLDGPDLLIEFDPDGSPVLVEE